MDPLIFQIGFNKSATSSIHRFLLSNGIKSIHWDWGRLSHAIAKNHEQGRPLLTGYDDYQAFCDMEHYKKGGGYFYSAERFFQELDEQYPGSLFILNYRNLDTWLESRRFHGNYLIHWMRQYGESAEEIFAKWRREYHEHIQAVKEHFGERSTFLELDLDRDDPGKLARFLENHGFTLQHRELPRLRMPSPGYGEGVEDSKRAIALAQEYEGVDITRAQGVLECAELFWPQNKDIQKRLAIYREILDKRAKREKTDTEAPTRAPRT